MKIKSTSKFAAALLLLSTFNAQLSTVLAQGAAFTYQGQLQNNGSPASGAYNLTFSLFITNTSGVPIAGPVTNNGVIINNGLFTVLVDFGPGVFTGGSNWLQIGVETNGAGSFTALTPRQQVTPVPYAISAEYAQDATALVNGAALGAGSGNSISTSGASDSFIGGGTANGIQYNSLYSAVSGGQDNIIQHDAGWSFIGGGQSNLIASGFSVIAGGQANNIISGSIESAIGGGQGNVISGSFPTYQSTIAGGYANTNSASYATVSGGSQNTASGQYATVPGGANNLAGGQYGFAAGQQAQALHPGAFVWADSQNAPFASTTNDQFSVRAQGGVVFHTLCAGMTLDGPLYISGCSPDIIYFGSALRELLMYADGNGNFFSGRNAGSSAVSGADNTAVGNGALQFIATGGGGNGNGNTAVGTDALNSIGAGFENTAIGGRALILASSFNASGNIALGYNAGASITFGANNIDIGNPGLATDANTIRIGTSQTATYLVGTVYANNVALISDRSAKEMFTPVNSREVLEKVSALPITEWKYKAENDGTQHLGPMAQDFHAAFGLNGADDKHIATVDEGGVALAAIQGLNEKMESARQKAETRIEKLEAENAELKARLEKLEQLMNQQTGGAK